MSFEGEELEAGYSMLGEDSALWEVPRGGRTPRLKEGIYRWNTEDSLLLNVHSQLDEGWGCRVRIGEIQGMDWEKDWILSLYCQKT